MLQGFDFVITYDRLTISSYMVLQSFAVSKVDGFHYKAAVTKLNLRNIASRGIFSKKKLIQGIHPIQVPSSLAHSSIVVDCWLIIHIDGSADMVIHHMSNILQHSGIVVTALVA